MVVAAAYNRSVQSEVPRTESDSHSRLARYTAGNIETMDHYLNTLQSDVYLNKRTTLSTSQKTHSILISRNNQLMKRK